MSRHKALAALLVVFLSSLPLPASGDIYKCVGSNGEITFAQAPCAATEGEVSVVRSDGRVNSGPADCEYARRFALTTAQQMRSGADSRTIYDSYGGLSALSRGSVSLISYVFQFRTNDDVSATRVSALATAKCQARAFGDVSCEQLPASFTLRFGGCSVEEEELFENPPITESTNVLALNSQQLVHRAGAGSSLETSAQLRAREREAKVAEEEKRLECRDRYRSQIDNVNATMRGGYTSSQGESLRKKLRELEAKSRQC